MTPSKEVSAERALEQRARRMAKRVGLVARKSRQGIGSANNCGGFRLVDQNRNVVEAGYYFELSPEDVIEYCAVE